MKNTILLLGLLLSVSIAWTQTPQAFKYQGVARDNGAVLDNASISVEFTIRQSSASGTEIYQERHFPTTNEFGLFSLNVGEGATVTIGDFTTIDWSVGPYFLQVKMDPVGGGTYQDMGTSQLLSVPYALYAEKANTAEDTNWSINGDNIVNNNAGNVGIGTGSDPVTTRLQVKDNDFSQAGNGVIRSEFTSTLADDGIAVYGYSRPIDYYGIGGYFEGGWRGVIGQVSGTGDNSYYGVYGTASSDGEGTTYGVYGTASGGSNNYAGYFSGNAQVTSTLFVGGTIQDRTEIYNDGTATTFSSNGTRGVRLSTLGANSNNGWLGVYDDDGDDLVRLTVLDGDIGFLSLRGPNTLGNVLLSSLSSNSNHGYISVRDASGVNQAGMYVDASGNGYVFADGASGGVKSFTMQHPDLPDKRIWYACIEGPEVASYDRGTAQLVYGEMFISYSDHFKIVTNLETVTINLTPRSANTYGLAVIDQTEEGFLVKELMNGTGNFAFDWEVKGKRNGHEDFQVIRSNSAHLGASTNSESSPQKIPSQPTEKPDPTISKTK